MQSRGGVLVQQVESFEKTRSASRGRLSFFVLWTGSDAAAWENIRESFSGGDQWRFFSPRSPLERVVPPCPEFFSSHMEKTEFDRDAAPSAPPPSPQKQATPNTWSLRHFFTTENCCLHPLPLRTPRVRAHEATGIAEGMDLHWDVVSSGTTFVRNIKQELKVRPRPRRQTRSETYACINAAERARRVTL